MKLNLIKTVILILFILIIYRPSELENKPENKPENKLWTVLLDNLSDETNSKLKIKKNNTRGIYSHVTYQVHEKPGLLCGKGWREVVYRMNDWPINDVSSTVYVYFLDNAIALTFLKFNISPNLEKALELILDDQKFKECESFRNIAYKCDDIFISQINKFNKKPFTDIFPIIGVSRQELTYLAENPAFSSLSKPNLSTFRYPRSGCIGCSYSSLLIYKNSAVLHKFIKFVQSRHIPKKKTATTLEKKTNNKPGSKFTEDMKSYSLYPECFDRL